MFRSRKGDCVDAALYHMRRDWIRDQSSDVVQGGANRDDGGRVVVNMANFVAPRI